MKPLVLLSDAFGGHGGIAKFNRDLLHALCAYPGLEGVTAIPRIMPHAPESMPSNLKYITGGLNSKSRYARTLLRYLAGRGRDTDLIVCGHINLLPFALLAKKMTRAPIVLIIHGIDAWDSHHPQGHAVRPAACGCGRQREPAHAGAIPEVVGSGGSRLLRAAQFVRARAVRPGT